MKATILFTLSFLTVSTFNAETKKECTGEISQQRSFLLEQAQKQKESFQILLKECSLERNCHMRRDFCQVVQDIEDSIEILAHELQAIEQGENGSCNLCERKRTKKVHEELVELLGSVPAQEDIDS